MSFGVTGHMAMWFPRVAAPPPPTQQVNSNQLFITNSPQAGVMSINHGILVPLSVNPMMIGG